ncbi:hypothetical protein M3201_17980 [Paenibacillus motobuensis]|uniref:hypothetical protein n=1 Tax=Paenibacillus TaxID=44249 RepID=UPI00203B57BE|nr:MULTISPECIES: hypothetical protein [Paenibacillus]MCM3041587.1 hypothetical protein [Paenibacillus lutimineralis]MCM3648691.1 hypothetical protein [Paenibacillus motobuensis]
MALNRGAADQDYIIEQVVKLFQCRVLWSEGRPCLEYSSLEELDKVTEYVKDQFAIDLFDVFFTAVESLPEDD